MEESPGKTESDGAVYFSKSSQALLPLPKIAWMEVCGSKWAILAASTLRMLLSEEPMISQLFITSQTAMLCFNRRCFFSSMSVGIGSFVI